MEEFGCRSIVFSSSATVYGSQEVMPILESSTVGMGITNAYGRTKYMIEGVLRDFHRSSAMGAKNVDGNKKFSASGEWSVIILRYFNPVGAHPSGLIGEDPNGIPNNLMPYVGQVAVGRREYLTVFGDDYDTPDGTGVRDYIHVMDLGRGHLSAIEYMEKKGGGLWTFNLGTGTGYSVLDMVKAMEKACGNEIKYKVGPRRGGDIATCYADSSLAKKEMGWEAKLGLDEMCRDLWCWQEKNPNGFKGMWEEKGKYQLVTCQRNTFILRPSQKKLLAKTLPHNANFCEVKYVAFTIHQAVNETAGSCLLVGESVRGTQQESMLRQHSA